MAQRGKNEISSGADYQTRLLAELANMHENGGTKWFWQKWQKEFWPETPERLLQLRNELREIWDLESGRRQSDYWDTEEDELLNRWLSYRPTPEEEQLKNEAKVRSLKKRYGGRIQQIEETYPKAVEIVKKLLEGRQSWEEQLRKSESDESSANRLRELGEAFEQFERFVSPNMEKLKSLKVNSLEEEYQIAVELSLRRGYLPFRCSASQGGFVPDPANIRAVLILAVMENHGYMRYCANPDCATPYFVAKRKDQTVCDAGECKAERQRLHALKWWRENRATKGSVQPRMGTISKKAKKEHVARKTR